MPLVLILILIAGSIFAQKPIPVGSQKQLFIDYKFIESADGIQLMMQEPYQTREKLIVADQPWEEEASLGSYNTIVQEGDNIRLWYDIRAGAPPPGQRNPLYMGMAYAESRDGLHFTKPVLNLVKQSGSRKNNWVLPPDPELQIGRAHV